MFENPFPLIFVGIAVEAILGVMLYVTGRGMYFLGMLGVMVLVLGGVALEWVIVTERERVEQTIEEMRSALEANDLDRVLACCSQSAEHTRREAKRALGWVHFTRIKITDQQIDEINELTSPPTTMGHFIAVISAYDRKGDFGQRTQPIKFHLTFRLEGDRWLISEHELDNAPGGF